MKKLLINMSKKIICILMIMSFILPSYADSSFAGDNGSFITKEEFDSAISDFNKRLITFEAGINTKIDMQVTSYLDRNGIWAGEDQTTIGVEFEYNVLCNALTDFIKNYIQKNGGTEKVLSTNEIISSVTKTGMMYVETSWDQAWSAQVHGNNSSLGNTYSHALFEGAGKGLVSFGVYNNASGTSVFEEYSSLPGFIIVRGGSSGDGGGESYNTQSGDVIISGGEQKISTMFFVDKGEKIYCRSKLCWGGRTNTGGYCGSFDTNGGCSINGVKTAPTATTPVKLLFTASVY